jgi:hypothetical protein
MEKLPSDVICEKYEKGKKRENVKEKGRNRKEKGKIKVKRVK